MNAQPAITREELDDGFAQLRDEVVALKKAVASIATRGEAGTPGFRAGDFVHKGEFRLFKWVSGLALVAILGGFGFLYQGLADLRVTVERQHGELRSHMDRRFAEVDRQFAEVDRRFAELHGEMDRQFAELYNEMDRRFAELRNEMDRRFAEMDRRFAEMDQRFAEVDRQFAEVGQRFADIRERLVRVEILMAGESPANEADTTDAR